MQKLIASSVATAGMLSLALVVGASAGCSLEPSVPGSPTYVTDVEPILAARCVRCHGNPPLQQPPSGLPTPGVRFDVYSCMPDGGVAGCVRAAKEDAMTIVGRLQLAKNNPLHMPPPPAVPLSQYQVDTIVKWVAAGAPEM